MRNRNEACFVTPSMKSEHRSKLEIALFLGTATDAL